MKYLSCYDRVWSLSDARYRRFLRHAAAGRAWNLDDYGKVVVPDIDLNVTDLTAEDAQELLQALRRPRRLAGRREPGQDQEPTP